MANKTKFKWKIDKIASCQTGKLTKWHFDKMSRRQNVFAPKTFHLNSIKKDKKPFSKVFSIQLEAVNSLDGANHIKTFTIIS
jgi:hypothetical protein